MYFLKKEVKDFELQIFNKEADNAILCAHKPLDTLRPS